MKKIINRLKEFWAKEYSENTFKNSENRTRKDFNGRSIAYRNHFEGYIIQTKLDKNGKKRQVRIYAGIWYTPDLSRKQRIDRKILYGLIWLISLFILVFCATRSLTINSLWYGALAQAAAMGSLLWIFLGLFNYLTVPLNRTIGEFSSSTGSLKKSTLAAAVAFGINFLLHVTFMCNWSNTQDMQLICTCGYVVVMGLMLFWNRMERKTVYRESQNNQVHEKFAASDT